MYTRKRGFSLRAKFPHWTYNNHFEGSLHSFESKQCQIPLAKEFIQNFAESNDCASLRIIAASNLSMNMKFATIRGNMKLYLQWTTILFISLVLQFSYRPRSTILIIILPIRSLLILYFSKNLRWFVKRCKIIKQYDEL